MIKFAFGTHDYRIYYVNIDLRHQYGISVVESQTFLLAKRPSASMSEKKRLPFAGYHRKDNGETDKSSCILIVSFLLKLSNQWVKYALACVASVSVLFRSKERPMNEIFGFGARPLTL